MRLFGIEVFLDWSLLFVFVLVAFSLGTGVLATWHPDWSSAVRWTVALAAALAFFASVLAHELSHGLVGRAVGIDVRRITLFVFGGMAHMESEPKSPKAELLMAAVGPFTSLVIGVVSTLVGGVLAGIALDGAVDAENVPRLLGPVATVLLWLGPVNLVLAVFNLVPGFPLDGGRVLRAALWWATGDMLAATRWASLAGRAVGLALITCGVFMVLGFRVPYFGTGFGGGIWLVFIGWFLQNAARASYEQLVIRHHLATVPVARLLRTDIYTVRPELSVAELVNDYVMGTDQTSFPVVVDGELVGNVTAREVKAVPMEHWRTTTVGQVMAPAASLPAIAATEGADRALERLAASGAEQLPVLDRDRHLRGFVRRQDILKWLMLQPEPIG